MAVAFTRQLGYESGVQLNPTQDNNQGAIADNSDQVFAIAMRCDRGRIDKPFVVDNTNFLSSVGRGKSVRVNALNEAQGACQHALKKGAYEALVYRLHTDEAKLRFILVKQNDDKSIDFSIVDEMPDEPFMLLIKHMGCFNDGIKVELHASEKENEENGSLSENDVITLTIYDSNDVEVFKKAGSLEPDAKDSFGTSYYLPDVVGLLTDEVEIEVGSQRAIPVGSPAYGLDVNGYSNTVKSDVQIYFTEGSTAYSAADYSKARKALRYHPRDFAYLATGGNQSVSFIQQMAEMAYDLQKQLRVDIDGRLSPKEAVAFKRQFNFSEKMAEFVHFFWMPVKSNDPTGLSGKYHMGASTANIALSCARNAIQNEKGFAKKQQPIAGFEYDVPFTGMVQTYSPTDQELSLLAQNRINPVVYETYASQGKFVFRDSLTSIKNDNSPRKLIATVEMSTSLNDAATKYGKQCLQKPMQEAVELMKRFLKSLLEGAENAGWLVTSEELNGASFAYEVFPSDDAPHEKMIYKMYMRFDGTARQMVLTQVIAKP